MTLSSFGCLRRSLIGSASPVGFSWRVKSKRFTSPSFALASFALQPAREGSGPVRLLAIRQP